MFERHNPRPSYRERQETRYDTEIRVLNNRCDYLQDCCRWLAYSVVACIVGIVLLVIVLVIQSKRISKITDNAIPQAPKAEIVK